MIIIPDQRQAVVPVPLDAKLSNVQPSGANTIVESISTYLQRVSYHTRYLGMIVPVTYPAGIYNNNTYFEKIDNGDLQVALYGFISGIEDEDFLPWCPSCDPPIVQTRWVVISTTCELDEDGKRTGLAIISEKEEKKVDAGPWTETGATRTSSVYNPITCPLPGTREVEVSRACEFVDGERTGYLTILKNVEEQDAEGNWIIVQTNKEYVIYDAAECPPPSPPAPQYRFVYGSWSCIPDGIYFTGYKTRTVQREISLDGGDTWAFDSNYPNETSYDDVLCEVTPYGAWMTVGDPNYDYLIEINMPFDFGIPLDVTSPTKPDYNYLFVSIPSGRTFSLRDSMGENLRKYMVTVGSDIRVGYRNNTIYRVDDMFASDYSSSFVLTVN